MARKVVEVEIPDGTRLGFAQDAEGGRRGLLFDNETNKLVGHAELFDHELGDDSWTSSGPSRDGGDDEDKTDEAAEAIAQALTALVFIGLEAAAPHVRQWWQSKAAPALKSAPGKVRSRVQRRGRSETTESDDDAVAAGLVQRDPGDASADPRQGRDQLAPLGPVMSSSEAEERLAYAVAAMAFAREQMTLLRDARIVDDGQTKLAGALDDLTPRGLEEAVHLMLEANPSMLNGSDLVALRVGLGEGEAPDPVASAHSIPRAERGLGKGG